ncbi:DUF2513 domain-containing protein [Caenimonas aquaedulcis]|uniref:DUF2513 domain-containing protein n=1 Tax=Caenimonas aquaedulcis TaxID=2793270 RepID=A0A931H6B5_9BURK|nr:DUF2513 domain-containing protein [Caenimonas aquaedulcis]MBG9389338.1 DUF2513 domain-containing protein [Caenimonas aquaedulcis]
MKRDWDVIRDVLAEVEEHDIGDPESLEYEVSPDEFSIKAQHAILLWKSGFLTGFDATDLSREALLNPALTWEGHELLDTLRSKPIWDEVKKTAKTKGIELSFEAVKALGKAALAHVLTSGA